MSENELKELESIKKLLILSLLRDKVTPEAIAKVLNMATITIRKMAPMKKIKKSSK